MSIFRLIFREIRFRKGNFILGFLAFTAGVGLFVAFFTCGEASNRETIRLMRDIGFNLRIIPLNTDMEKFWNTGYSEFMMPEQYVYEMSQYKGISYNHLTAMLQKKITWRDREVILMGMAPEVIPEGKKTSVMSFSIQPGTVHIGYQLTEALDIKEGDSLALLGKILSVARLLPETGTSDDIRIYCDLKDAQDILGLPGLINEIKALQCLCKGGYSPEDSLKNLREELVRILPETRVVFMTAIASARQRQRLLVERYFNFIFPLVALVVLGWIGILTYLNVRERRSEIGMMRALGFGSWTIGFLFLGKGIFLGILGAVAGYLAGTFAAEVWGPGIFLITAKSIHPSLQLFFWTLIASLLAAAVSVFIPTAFAISQDPARILQDE